MKMSIRWLKHIGMLLITFGPLALAGMIILPFVLPFIPKDQEYLPKCLRWFDNNERYFNKHASNVDGLAGSDKYRAQQGLTSDSSALKLFYVRYKWLAFRNAVNYFKYKHLGLHWTSEPRSYIVKHYEGDPSLSERNPGKYVIVLEDPKTGKEYWEYYKTTKIPFLPLVFRTRMGWKIDHIDSNNFKGYTQWVCIPISILGNN